MQVIDISSSPEPSSSSMTVRTRSASRQPGPSKKRRRVTHEPSIIEYIELTDSDNDPPRSTKAPDAMLLFGRPNTQILRDPPASAPGSSRHAQHREQQGDVSLFLPSGNEEGPDIRPPQMLAALNEPPPNPPAPGLAQVDPVDEYIIRVLEIVPDVQPTHALALITQVMESRPGNVVELVLHTLFEDPSYPKVDRKGKHKRLESDGDSNPRGSSKQKTDYTSKDRVYNVGPHYFELSLEQLMMDFPRIPKPHIRTRLLNNRFYAPTYLLLAEELKRVPPPFKLKSSPSKSKSSAGKGKTRQDLEFDGEREWILLKVAELATARDAALAASVNEQEYEETGESIECGCCFSGYPFDQMIQCPEAHLFCKTCMISYASNLLGEHNLSIVCMDQSGCKLPFPESELGRFLSSKLLELYYRVKQRKEIEAAGLENLEECPFCDYKCVIENEMEKLFRCENVNCGAVTCRTCKKPDHLPKTCKEIESDKHLDAQHLIEEAMTQALMRKCPKCQKSFIKEMGCNKMSCPNCHTVSCYICRKIIRGYDHFDNSTSRNKADKSKCSLWDPVEQRHAEEVSEAAKQAMAELRQSRPDVDEAHIKVDIPAARAPPTRPGGGVALNGGGALPILPMGVHPMGGLGAMNFPYGGMGMGAGGAGGAGGGGMGMGIVAGGVEGAQGAGAGMAMGVRGPFMFGAGQAHPFVAPAFLAGAPPRFGAALDPPVAQVGQPPAMPLAQRRGRRLRAAPAPAPAPAPLPAQVQPTVVADGKGGRRRRRGR